MAEHKKSFVLYADLIHVVKKLVEHDRSNKTNRAGELFLHVLEYVNDNDPVPIDFIVDMAFEPIKIQLKRDLAKWEVQRGSRVESGRSGGIKSGESRRNYLKANEASASKSKQTQANEAVTVTVTDNVTVNATVTDNVTEEVSTPTRAKILRKRKELGKQPFVFRESEYFDKEKFSLALSGSGPPYCNANPDFYYDACLNGSDSKGYKYIDWIAAIKNWIRRDIQKGNFQSMISENIKIIQNGKSNYQTGRKQSGYSDAELAAAMEERRRSE